MANSAQLSIPARPEYVAVARLFVSTFASSRRELDDERIDDLRLAVSEACTNAVEAHVAAGLDQPIIVRVDESNDGLEIHVIDRGGGFDVDALPSHPPVTDPERLHFERGLGVPLIRSLVDAAAFDTGDDGTDVRMSVLCPPALDGV
jgi:serine/threonine-protein kinase RsbW